MDSSTRSPSILPDIADKITLTVRSELDKKFEELEKKRVEDAAATAVAPVEPEPPAVPFNFSGNWRRLIGVTKTEPSNPNPFTDHEEVVEADDEAIFNEIVPVTPRDMIINMKVEPDSPIVEEQKQPVSHTMHFN